MDNKVMFDFYKMSYEFGYLKKEDLQEPTKWKCITREEYKIITGEEYVGEVVGETKPTKPIDKPINTQQ